MTPLERLIELQAEFPNRETLVRKIALVWAVMDGLEKTSDRYMADTEGLLSHIDGLTKLPELITAHLEALRVIEEMLEYLDRDEVSSEIIRRRVVLASFATRAFLVKHGEVK